MYPSAPVIEHGTPLTLDEFSSEFHRAWSRLRSRFLKLECWQAYQELESNRSQQAYRQGHLERARTLLREEAEGDRPLYEDIRARRLDYARVRVVQEPLTDYLRYEMLSYQLRAEMGEAIVVVTVDRDVDLPSQEFFDFLLFDRHTALVHDYGTGPVGAQTGGWLVNEASVLETLERTVLSLRQRSVPVLRYLSAVPPEP